MTTEAIVESEMTFGPYPEGECFYIEKSQCYRKIQQGVPIAEFLLLQQQKKGPVVWIIEAKSSSPRPETRPNFKEFIDEIRNKLTNAFWLIVAARLQRHSSADAELSEPFKRLNLQTQRFRLALVIRGHQKDWLPPLQDALNRALCPTIKTWGLPSSSVVVLSDDSARQYGLIRSSVPTETP